MQRKKTRTHWNPAYDNIPTSYVPRVKFSHMYSKDAVNMANSVLEIGCGTGSYTKLIDSKKTIGIDLDVYALRIAKKYCPYTEFIAASATNLPIKNEILDLVCIWGVFEEIPVGTEIELISETKRVLKRGATLLFSASTNNIICKCLNPAFILGRMRHYDTNLLFDLLTKRGFVLNGYTLRGGTYTIISNFMVYFYKHILHRKSGKVKKFFESKSDVEISTNDNGIVYIYISAKKSNIENK